ncbi:hypothetical protein [Streptomyces sp. NPDC055400]
MHFGRVSQRLRISQPALVADQAARHEQRHRFRQTIDHCLGTVVRRSM